MSKAEQDKHIENLIAQWRTLSESRKTFKTKIGIEMAKIAEELLAYGINLEDLIDY